MDMNQWDLTACRLCPRNCGVNRHAGQTGFCGLPEEIRAARAARLYYEEPCISGTAGSGAIFFTGCSLGCVFCQNAAISGGLRAASPSSVPGEVITSGQLCEIMLRLQEEGAANINLVTPSHVLHVLIPALEAAKTQGLHIPVVYNTSSYEKAEMLRRLEGLVDIYLPDLKYRSEALSSSWSKAPDYWDIATRAIAEMVRQCPRPLFSDGSSSLDEADDSTDPMMVRGVIVRHMVMPGQVSDSKEVLRYLYHTYGDQIFVSIMNQYTPMPQCRQDPLLSRPTTKKEYDEVTDFAISLGIENGFLQEGGTISQSFIPAWDGTGIRTQ